jgi:hypothetical protein
MGNSFSLPLIFTCGLNASNLNNLIIIAIRNDEIMRAFVRLRQMIASNRELAKRLDELEKKYDSQFKIVF